MELKLLSLTRRIAVLEKLVRELSKWTKFDLRKCKKETFEMLTNDNNLLLFLYF